ncbi:MAG: hypothetical protein ACF8QF_05450 [Phycisphaerales bacterium]
MPDEQTPPEQPKTPTAPDEATQQALDALRESLQGEAARETTLTFWEAVLGLDAWHFIASADMTPESMQEGQGPAILTLANGQTKFVPVYSTHERAEQAGAHWSKEAGKDGATAVVEIAMPRALAYVCSAFPGVEALMFDNVPGTHNGFGTTIDTLPGMYAHFHGVPPGACFGAMARTAVRANAKKAYLDAYRVLAGLKVLFAIQTADGRLALAPANDKLLFPFFTQMHAAEQFASQQEGAKVVKFPPAELLNAHAKCTADLGEKFAGLVADATTSPLGIDIDLFREAMTGQQVGG